MFAAATSLFARSALNANYHIQGQPGFPSIASPSFGSSAAARPTAPAAIEVPPFSVGLWRILKATNKTTQKVVSVWMFDKKQLDHLKGPAKELVLEVLRKEATAMSRLRHPGILEMVEPMEETRSEITFATEPILSSLAGSLSSARAGGVLEGVDLDEIEIQKGILQIASGLSFLHSSAKLIHNNISPESILINAKGDWKLGALSLTTSTTAEGGARWSFPEHDNRLPESVQRRWDFMAPEYAIDEQVTTSSDLYALGCVIYAVHLGGRPPFQNHNSLSTLRQNAERVSRGDIGSSAAMGRLGNDLRDLLAHLITRTPANRLTSLTLSSHAFFSNLAISTLLFLDRTTFSSKPKEEKATFLRGLLRVLPNFSDRLRKRKILPSLLEEMKDPWLLPFILPNVFEIAKSQTKEEFNLATLPALQPLFALTDPPQNMLTLLESLPLFMEKTSPAIFREHIMPLIYNSLDSEHPEVQERALKAVPTLLDVLDVGSIQDVLFVRVAILFTKTRVLSVKVSTLACFLSMVKVLDRTSLTQKLVPLLAKIKTKEPDVMMATLAVHEAMGAKVDREAVATLVLPQLWTFSMGPLLTVEHFNRFMATIKTLSARVEQEHSQHLRENHRIQSQSAQFAASQASNGLQATGEVDFESLVNGANRPKPDGADGQVSISADPWGDDPWESIGPTPTSAPPASSARSSFASTSSSPSPYTPAATSTSMLHTSTSQGRGSLGARPVPASTFNAAAFPSLPPPSPLSSFQPLSPTSVQPPSMPASFPTLYPTTSSLSTPSTSMSALATSSSGPNYGVSVPSTFASAQQQQPVQQQLHIPTPLLAPGLTSSAFNAPRSPLAPPMSQLPSPSQPPLQPTARAPPGYSSASLLTPTTTSSSRGNGTFSEANTKAVADEFDPFA